MRRVKYGVAIGAAVMLLVAAGAVVHADETQQSEQTIETDLPEQALPGEQITVKTHWESDEEKSHGIILEYSADFGVPNFTESNAELSTTEIVIGGPVLQQTISVSNPEGVEPLTYEMGIPVKSDTDPGRKAFISQQITPNAVDNSTVEIVEPSVDYYATEDGEITVESLEHALRNWRRGVIETSLLRDVVVEWRATS